MTSSTPLWLLTTCNRPEACQKVLDACTATRMRSRGILWVDQHQGRSLYRDLRIPDNWEVRHPSRWGSIGQAMEWVLNEYPDASRYGWLADDTYPRTKHWDTKLEKAADNGNLSYARDLWLSESNDTRTALVRGFDLSSGLCWGGDLVRAVGWWNLPGTRQAGIDTAWTAIVGKLRRARYVENVIVEHHNWRTGKRPKDSSDEWVRNGQRYVEQDIRLRDEWLQSRDYIDTLDRIARLCPQRTEFELATVREIVKAFDREERRRMAEEKSEVTRWEYLPIDRRQKHLNAGGKPYDVVNNERVERPTPTKKAAAKPKAEKK